MAFRPLAGFARARTWTASLHLLADLPLGIIWFTTVVTLLSLSAGLLVTLVGIPLLALTLLFSRVISVSDRHRARLLLGVTTADPFRPLVADGSWWTRAKSLFSDPAGWKALVYGLLMLPWGVVTFTVTTVAWTVPLWLVTFPAWGWAVAVRPITGDPLTGSAKSVVIAAGFVLGLVLLPFIPVVIRGLAAADAWLVRGLLGRDPSTVLQERVEQLEVSRAASVEGAAEELRRIERDLHDGAQQRLVALAMDLGLARERLARGDDPQRAAELVANAHDEAKLAIAELRDLVRGIHPAVLTDRGLDAALSALAARCPVPVTLDVDVPERPPASIEAAAYFVVAEALTNVAKHSRATAATVRVCERAGRLLVDIGDDGVGGAAVKPVGGLSGLRDRVLAVEGRLRVASPEGGPTTIAVELPLGSSSTIWPAPTIEEKA